MTEKIVRLLDLDPQHVQPLYSAMFELGQNAVEHSGRTGGYVALQTFPARNAMVVAIADAGRGVRSSLAGSGQISTDEEALRLAARKYVSSTGKQSRGRGITGVIELARRPGEAVSLVSGNAVATFTRGHWDPRVETLPVPLPGTLAQASFAVEGRMIR